MMHDLLPFKGESVKGLYKKPSTEQFGHLDSKTKKGIDNAWDKIGIINDEGIVWVESSKLHTVIRTTKGSAKYWVSKLNKNEKIVATNGDIYVSGSSLCKKLDEQVYHAGKLNREDYLEYAYALVVATRRCSRARELRARRYEQISEKLKRLKSTRIKGHKITKDELTGDNLNIRTAEFSHIRSKSAYPQIAHYLDNGLIVNKSTHDLITRNNVNDEEELLLLCQQMSWSTKWYNNFKKSFCK